MLNTHRECRSFWKVHSLTRRRVPILSLSAQLMNKLSPNYYFQGYVFFSLNCSRKKTSSQLWVFQTIFNATQPFKSVTLKFIIFSSELIRLHEFTVFNMNLMLLLSRELYILRVLCIHNHYHNTTKTTKLQSIKRDYEAVILTIQILVFLERGK